MNAIIPSLKRIRDLPTDEQPLYRITRHGPAALSTSELLTLLLGLPSLEMARDLLTRYPTLTELARASDPELEQLQGIGPAGRARLQAAFELGRRLRIPQGDIRQRIASPADAAQLVMGDMSHLDREQLRVILLDTRHTVIRIETIYHGSLNSCMVRLGELFQLAIAYRATSLIAVHNHPSGDVSPSPEDIRLTRELVKAGELLDIQVLDHLIIGNNRFASLKERGLGFA